MQCRVQKVTPHLCGCVLLGPLGAMEPVISHAVAHEATTFPGEDVNTKKSSARDSRHLRHTGSSRRKSSTQLLYPPCRSFLPLNSRLPSTTAMRWSAVVLVVPAASARWVDVGRSLSRPCSVRTQRHLWFFSYGAMHGTNPRDSHYLGGRGIIPPRPSIAGFWARHFRDKHKIVVLEVKKVR